MRWVEIETSAGFCIVHGFDFEDSKRFVRPCCHRAGCRVVPFADADLMVGNSGRFAAKAGAASPPTARVIATSSLVMDRFISRFEDQCCKEVEGQWPLQRKRRSGIALHLLGAEG
jgi:hypothetical protein